MFRKKSQLFFWKYFSTRKKLKFSMGFFFNSISWSRRIVLKRLHDNSGSIKRRKVTRKKCWSYKFEPFWGHFAIWAMHDTRRSGCPTWKNQDIFFSTKNFVTKKIFFFDNFFSNIKSYISALKCTTVHGQRTSLQKTAHDIVSDPPLSLKLKLLASYNETHSVFQFHSHHFVSDCKMNFNFPCP